jgi:hypothetical protein
LTTSSWTTAQTREAAALMSISSRSSGTLR